MRLRSLLPTVALLFALLFALPALAQEQPRTCPVAEPAPSLVYEVRLLKLAAGTCDRAGVKLTRDTTLTDAQLRTLLEAAQADRDASVMQFPKVTVGAGESATVKVGDERSFVTGLEAVKVKGQNVLVPKNNAVHVGEVVTVSGRPSADGNFVQVRAEVTQTRVVGTVELVPVTTQVTPVFEGGSQGKPVPFTQFLQAPDLRKEHVERAAVVPNGGTLLVGSWKEVAKPGKEYEVVALATVRAVKAEANAVRVYKLRNVAAVDVAQAVTEFARSKKQNVLVVAEAASNSVCVASTADGQKQVADLIAALDKEPQQVLVQALVLEVADGFLETCGLTADPAKHTLVLTPREVQALNEGLRVAKEKGGVDVLSRPQLQVADNQTGFVQVGQQYPVVTAGGKMDFKQLGLTMRVTPRVAPDDKSVLLRAEAQHASVSTPVTLTRTALFPGTALPLMTFTAAPVFNTQELKTAANVPLGHTLVTRATETRTQVSANVDGTRTHTTVRVHALVILTPHLVAPVADVKPAVGWFTK